MHVIIEGYVHDVLKANAVNAAGDAARKSAETTENARRGHITAN